MNFIIYIAMSLDGYIADKNGQIDWLTKYNEIDCGYAEFIQNIDCMVIGRSTYEQVLSFGDWPYAAQKTYVLSQTSSQDEKIEGFYQDIDLLIETLKLKSYQNIWIMGGAKTCKAFMDKALINVLDLFIMPEILGEGIQLFDHNQSIQFPLVASHCYGNQIVRLTYNR